MERHPLRLVVLRDTAIRTLQFKAMEPGLSSVTLSVGSATNHPGVVVPVVVLDRASLGERMAGAIPTGVGAVVVLGGLLVFWRVKRRNS
jgi:hypothetical protein